MIATSTLPFAQRDQTSPPTTVLKAGMLDQLLNAPISYRFKATDIAPMTAFLPALAARRLI